MFILILSKEERGGVRVDKFFGVFASRMDAIAEALALSEGESDEWRELTPGTGPFDSYACSILGNAESALTITRSDFSARESVAVLEYGP